MLGDNDEKELISGPSRSGSSPGPDAEGLLLVDYLAIHTPGLKGASQGSLC